MTLQMTPVGPIFGQYVRFMRFALEGDEYLVERYRTQARWVLATLEERLGVLPFLGGQSYSIADIATFPWARGVGTFLCKPAKADYPKLMVWVATINGRSAVTRPGCGRRGGPGRRRSTRPGEGPKTASSAAAPGTA
jgi:GST-like protein